MIITTQPHISNTINMYSRYKSQSNSKEDRSLPDAAHVCSKSLRRGLSFPNDLQSLPRCRKHNHNDVTDVWTPKSQFSKPDQFRGLIWGIVGPASGILDFSPKSWSKSANQHFHQQLLNKR